MTSMTSLFAWNDSFATDLPLVDEQHQRLVGVINGLGQLAMAAGAVDPQAIANARAAIFDYARRHFSDEEALMEEARIDPRHLERHRSDHQSFLCEALLLGTIGDDAPSGQVYELVQYLVHWLAYHILGVDQDMARQVWAIRNGKSPARAFEENGRHAPAATAPLLETLNRLFHVVSKRNHELLTLNRELEKRVRERTRELEGANRQLELLSTHDELTGLPNRRFADSTLKQLWTEAQRYGSPLSALMLDADRFKEVNDRFGHAEGDALLRALAARLRQAVRGSDIVCRLGGDEFLVICPRTTKAGAAEVAKKILAARQPFRNADGVECWDGSISIGFAEAGKAMRQPQEMLQAADEALYAAKRRGGARMAAGNEER